MTYDFFAYKTDKIKILEFIFNETDLQVYDLSSPYGQEISRYERIHDIIAKFNFEMDDKSAVTFQLWTPRHKGKPIFRKIKLDPSYCNGHSFRYSTDGWGMIQLYFGGIQNNQLHKSHLGHFNEKQAMKWESTNSSNGQVNSWDWIEIQTTSKKLKHQIHNKMAIKKVGTFGILPEAGELEKKEIIFTH